MPHSIFLRPFIDELARTSSRAEDELTEEFRAAAEAAVHRALGRRTPLSVELSPELGTVRVAQALTVVDVVRDPRRELSLLDARRVDATARVGDVLRIPIHYTHDPRERPARERLAAIAPRLPLPLHAEGLWDALTDALNEATQRYFPAPRYAEGTLWRLLEGGGGWTRGLSASAGGVTLTVRAAFLNFVRLDPHSGWVELGYDVHVDGAVVYGGGDLWRLRRGDNDGVVRAYGELPADASARERFLAELRALAELLASAKSGTGALSEVSACDRLNRAALRPPADGSLMRWCQDRLPALLADASWTYAGSRARPRAVTVSVSAVHPPAPGLSGFGHGALELRAVDERSGATAIDTLSLGALDVDALDPGTGPDDARARADIEALVARYREWLEVHLAHHLAGDDAIGPHYLYDFAGHLPLVELIQHRVREGPPGAPPVPALEPTALDAAARRVRAVTASERARARALLGPRVPLALFAAGSFLVALCDDLTRAPYSDAWIGLLPASAERFSEVMRVDVWNPAAKAVVDGDALAFRRFSQWLRGVLPRAGLDATVTFRELDDDELEDNEETDELDAEDGFEDEDEDDEEEERTWSMRLSTWLRFGLPAAGEHERFLLDWRHQWYVVFAGASIVECFAGIYGMSGAQRRALETRDRQVWRAFLRELVDPRFPG